MKIIKAVSEMKDWSAKERAGGKEIVLVPTMGFLHRGHGELLRAGRGTGGSLVLSIFVNPAQFGPKEDYANYPRDLEKDLVMAEKAGVAVVFAPEADDIYPAGFQTSVEVAGLSESLCGAARPGHFRGVCTVVLKLFNIVSPHRAVFGKKDFQQLQIIKRMVKDLDLGVGIIGVETVREPDGLAMSSRNSYLNPEERKAALCVPRALEAAQKAFDSGQRQGQALIEEMKKIMEKEPLAVVEYIKVCDPDTLEDAGRIGVSALAAVAARIGRARLIDNRVLGG